MDSQDPPLVPMGRSPIVNHVASSQTRVMLLGGPLDGYHHELTEVKGKSHFASTPLARSGIDSTFTTRQAGTSALIAGL